jgi:nonsense-mediated mRNA decay protein 3
MSGEFCPRCGESIEGPDPASGAESADTAGSAQGRTARDRALCDACYVAEYDLVDAPDRIEVRVCAQCGAVHRGNRWVDVGAEDYTDIAIEEVREALGVHVDATDVSWEVAPEQVDETTIRMHCTFTGVLRTTPLTEEVVVPVKISRETCKRCGRIAGGSYGAVVQVRARDREPTEHERDRASELAHELVTEREADGDREAFVTEITRVAGGLDIRLSTSGLGEQVARRLVADVGGTVEDYGTLVTEDEDGNEVYRVTYAVHLPPYRAGEIIDPEDGDGPVLVQSARGTLTGTRLASGKQYQTAFEDGEAPDARRVGKRADTREATVVAVVDAHAVQVLDPDSYETRTVPRPSYFDPDADTVSVVRSHDGLYILPAESQSGDE